MYKIITNYKSKTLAKTEFVALKNNHSEAIKTARMQGKKDASLIAGTTTQNTPNGILIQGSDWDKSYTVVERILPKYLTKRTKENEKSI